MILARLPKEDQFVAHSVAFARAVGTPDKVDRSVQKVNLHEGIARDAESIGAEMVVARYFGIKDFEPTVDGFKLHADIGANIEVKWTRWKDGSLILTERDRDSDIAVLVTNPSPDYYICGWIDVKSARRPTRQRSDGSYWIAQQDLHPIANLAHSSHVNPSI